ncbi:uncharacterized protein A4U43_C07F8970 [Asparagus officinalis]|uniref:Uncharacterized protein n=1 Tax=Asparagus officinalis TaxID=4686 RepID=A0A5P1EAI3_ASPOF|nr:uncharacterized protein A4U43_C07F8970 [Asparagus officinalis]
MFASRHAWAGCFGGAKRQSSRLARDPWRRGGVIAAAFGRDAAGPRCLTGMRVCAAAESRQGPANRRESRLQREARETEHYGGAGYLRFERPETFCRRKLRALSKRLRRLFAKWSSTTLDSYQS